MQFSPRKPQIEARAAFDAYVGDRWAMVVLATGVGKTKFANWIATDYLARGERVLWLAHRKELVTQPKASLLECWPEFGPQVGIVRADTDQYDRRMVIASKDTLKNERRLEAFLRGGKPGLIVVDEAHRSTSPTWQRVINQCIGPNTRVLGLTATPDRDDSSDLGLYWEIVYAYGIADAISDGILLPPYAAVYDIPGFDLRNVESNARDYLDDDLVRKQEECHVIDHTVEAMRGTYDAEALPFRDGTKRMSVGDRSTLLFTVTVPQAQQTSEALSAAGFESRFVSGNTPDSERARLLEAFKRRDIQVLCNAAVLTEGTDLPVASCVALVRPTKSWTLYVQTVGRGVRSHGDQDDALVLDLSGGMTRIHSLIAAPVFIKQGCLDSPDGAHRWMEVQGTGAGICQHCEARVPCAKRGGQHKWKNGTCSACGQIKCEPSPDMEHHWVPTGDNQQGCIHCGMEIPIPKRTVAGKKADNKRIPAAWQRLNTPGEVWAVNLGKLGSLYNVKVGDRWRPCWVPGGDKPRHLSTCAVPAEQATLLCADVLRKAVRAHGERVGEQSSERAYRKAFAEAETIARTYRLWRG